MLVLRAHGVEGFCTGLPAYRALREAFPRHHLVLATRPEVAPLAELTSTVDEVLSVPGTDAPLHWRGPSPDVAVNLQDQGPESHGLLHALWPARTIAYASAAAPGEVEGPPWKDGEDEVARWCRLLDSFGIEVDESYRTLRRPDRPSPAPGAVVIHVGDQDAGRGWPLDRYVAVSRALRSAGYEVVVTGSPPADGSRDVIGLAALVASAALVVSEDTGVAHLAVAFGIPSVTLCGWRTPGESGLPTSRPEHTVLRKALVRGPQLSVLTDAADRVPGAAAADGVEADRMLLALTPEDVQTAAEALLTPLPPPAVVDLTRLRPRAGSGTHPRAPRGSRGPRGMSGSGPRGPGRS
ncbi:MAG: glycosyltransferase family 9 protein [Actinomycetes bacterium]